MATRKALSKKLRFEVFKRDSFTCQYCGRAAPEVVLHADHIKPVSKNGDDDITNLITSCFDCNSGKGARELSDTAVIEKRKRQLDDLQERREQIEMMFDWQQSLNDLDGETVDMASRYWNDLTPGCSLNENGLISLKKIIKKYTVKEVLEAMNASAEQYLRFEDGNATLETVEKAFEYISRICSVQRQGPDQAQLFYIRGILRKRIYVNEWDCIEILRKAYDNGVSVEELKHIAIQTRNWTDWKATMYQYGAVTNGQ